MSILYKPTGHAGRSVPWAANLYRGCGHGCTYCFAPLATFTPRDQFHNEAHPRKDVIRILRRDLAKGDAPKGAHVMLCMTSDPYQPVAIETGITRQAIQAIHEAGLFVRIMTKAGTVSETDFDLLTPDDIYGCSLTFASYEDSKRVEPNAAPPGDRIEALKHAHEHGITTHVNLEPVIDPEQAIELVRRSHEYTDRYGVGPEGNMTEKKREMLKPVLALLDRLGSAYVIFE